MWASKLPQIVERSIKRELDETNPRVDISQAYMGRSILNSTYSRGIGVRGDGRKRDGGGAEQQELDEVKGRNTHPRWKQKIIGRRKQITNEGWKEESSETVRFVENIKESACVKCSPKRLGEIGSGKGDGRGSAVTPKSGWCVPQMLCCYSAAAGDCSQETDGGNKARSWVNSAITLNCLLAGTLHPNSDTHKTCQELSRVRIAGQGDQRDDDSVSGKQAMFKD